MKKLNPIEESLISTKVYERIREAIISGQFRPGTKLTVDILSEELKVSRTPVKEALVRLEREGLVESIPRRGMFVTKIDIEDAIEIYELREVLEGFAVRKFCENLDLDVLNELKELLKEGERYVIQGKLEKYSDIDEKFHKTIWDKSKNRRLFKFLENIRSQIRLLMTSSVNIPGRAEESLKEHKNIIKALEERNPDLAEEYMRLHIRKTKEVALKTYLEKTGEREVR
ncbi:MAG: GntR family transcriptional regulator [Dictyoglomaceae bacterium]